MLISETIFVTLCLFSSAYAGLNDWKKPCFDGVCNWDHQKLSKGPYAGSSGSMRIWGSPDAITDVTEAAGWAILECDPNSLKQTIRIACMHNNEDEAGCSHLFRNKSPVGKVVRLPENCGQMPFARIASYSVSKNQAIPAHLSKKFVARAAAPSAHELAIDTNFAAAQTKAGPVNIAIMGSNVPGHEGNASVIMPQPHRRSRINDRGILSFAENAVKQFSSFKKNFQENLPPLNIQKDLPLLNKVLSCPASGAVPATSISISADLNANAHAQVAIGIAVQGTVVPPKFTEVTLYSTLTADFAGTFDIKASGTANIDSGILTLAQVGVPGLNFPGILTLGPSIELRASTTVNLELDVNFNTQVTYSVQNAEVFFPTSGNKQSSANPAPKSTNLQLSVTPDLNGKGHVEVHVIPVVNLGLDALSGFAKAEVNLDFQASAALDMSFDATLSKSVGTNAQQSKSANGCVDLTGGIAINVGADANFFNLFTPNKQFSIFSKNFDIFQKCFGGATPHRRQLVRSRERRGLPGLTCAGARLATTQLVNQPIPGGSIKAKPK